jgi:hypothetical protein
MTNLPPPNDRDGLDMGPGGHGRRRSVVIRPGCGTGENWKKSNDTADVLTTALTAAFL